MRGRWIVLILALGFRFILDSSVGADTPGVFWGDDHGGLTGVAVQLSDRWNGPRPGINSQSREAFGVSVYRTKSN